MTIEKDFVVYRDEFLPFKRIEALRSASQGVRALRGLVALWGALITPLVALGLRLSLPTRSVPLSYYWGGEFAQAIGAGYARDLAGAAAMFALIVAALVYLAPRKSIGTPLVVATFMLPLWWLAVGSGGEVLSQIARTHWLVLWASITVIAFELWVPAMYYWFLDCAA